MFGLLVIYHVLFFVTALQYLNNFEISQKVQKLFQRFLKLAKCYTVHVKYVFFNSGNGYVFKSKKILV